MGPTLYRIITIYKSKAKLRHLKTKQEGQKEDKNVDSEKEEGGKEEEVPLKPKRQGEEETSDSKKAKIPKVSDFKEILPPASLSSPTK
uniref:Protein MNN4-like n=1 Tax=Cucumis melo TaxID=3656 RepID=A0A9I9CUQ0_CUCME